MSEKREPRGAIGKRPRITPKTVQWRDQMNPANKCRTRRVDKRASLPATVSTPPLIRRDTFIVFNSKNKNLPEIPSRDWPSRPPLLRNRTYEVLRDFDDSDSMAKAGTSAQDDADSDPAQSILNKTYIIRRAMPDVKEEREEEIEEELPGTSSGKEEEAKNKEVKNVISLKEKKEEAKVEVPKPEVDKISSGEVEAQDILLERIIEPKETTKEDQETDQEEHAANEKEEIIAAQEESPAEVKMEEEKQGPEMMIEKMDVAKKEAIEEVVAEKVEIDEKDMEDEDSRKEPEEETPQIQPIDVKKEEGKPVHEDIVEEVKIEEPKIQIQPPPQETKKPPLLLQEIPKRTDINDSLLTRFQGGHKVPISLLLDSLLSPVTRSTPGAAFDDDPVGNRAPQSPAIDVVTGKRMSFNAQCQTTLEPSQTRIQQLRRILQAKTNHLEDKRASVLENHDRYEFLKEKLEKLRAKRDAHELQDYNINEEPSVRSQFEKSRLIFMRYRYLQKYLSDELDRYTFLQECCICKSFLNRSNPELKKFFREKIPARSVRIPPDASDEWKRFYYVKKK